MGLGAFLSKQGQHADAIEALQESLAINQAGLPEGHSHIGRSLYELGMAYLRRGTPDDAEPRLMAALEIRDAALAPTHRERLMSLNGLADCYLAQARYDEAESLLRQALEGAVGRYGAGHERVVRAQERLHALREPRGAQ